MINLSIVIPCYNEEKNLPLLLNDFDFICKGNKFELILVDNGSNDNSWETLNSYLEKYKFLKILRIKKNLGYGHGIIKGLSIARGRYCGWTHADLQTDINDILKAYKKIEEANFPDNIYIKGYRKKRNFSEMIFTNGMTVFETIWLGMPLIDINAQPNIFPTNFLKYFINPPNNFLLDLYSYALAKKLDYKIIRFNVEWKKRRFGFSAWNINWKSKFIFSFKMILGSIPLKYKLSEIKKSIIFNKNQ